jgi:hypothetical protein
MLHICASYMEHNSIPPPLSNRLFLSKRKGPEETNTTGVHGIVWDAPIKPQHRLRALFK